MLFVHSATTFRKGFESRIDNVRWAYPAMVHWGLWVTGSFGSFDDAPLGLLLTLTDKDTLFLPSGPISSHLVGVDTGTFLRSKLFFRPGRLIALLYTGVQRFPVLPIFRAKHVIRHGPEDAQNAEG